MGVRVPHESAVYGVDVNQKLPVPQALDLIAPLGVGIGGHEIVKHVAAVDDDKCLRHRFSGLVADGSLEDQPPFFPQPEIDVLDRSLFVESNLLGVASGKSAGVVDGWPGIAFFGRAS